MLFFGTFLTHLPSTYIHPPSILSCVCQCASLSVRVVLSVSVCQSSLSLFALRVNDYFLKPEHNSFRSTNRSVYRPVQRPFPDKTVFIRTNTPNFFLTPNANEQILYAAVNLVLNTYKTISPLTGYVCNMSVGVSGCKGVVM